MAASARLALLIDSGPRIGRQSALARLFAEENLLDKLLRKRRSALHSVALRVANHRANNPRRTDAAVFIKIFILDSDSCFFEIIAQLVSLDHQFIISCSFIFPEQHIIAVIVFCNGSLDTLGDLAGTDFIEVLAEIRK